MKVSDEVAARDYRYLPGLDGLRAFAAISVAVGHILERDRTVTNSQVLGGLTLDGSNAVNLFLVLSGFLITRLLLIEREQTGTVSVRRFLTRRSLRILPLYYLVLALGVTLPFSSAAQTDSSPLTPAQIAILAIPFTANLILPNGGALVTLWSIGIEEQFYAVWSSVVRQRAVVIVALGMIGMRIALNPFLGAGDGGAALDYLWYTMRYDCLAIGALTAVLYTRWPEIIRKLSTPPMRIAAVAMFAAIVGFAPGPGIETEILGSCVFALLIVNVVGFPGPLESPIFRWVGQRSYGIYMWHMLVLAALYTVGLRDWGLVCAVLGATLVISALSYRYIESTFLRFKPAEQLHFRPSVPRQ